MMNSSYVVVDGWGEIMSEHSYTVDGLHDACEYAKNRESRRQFWSIQNPDAVDLDTPNGLSVKEKEYLEVVWGLV